MTRPKHQKRARDEEDEVVSKIKVPKSTKKTTKKAKTTAAASAARKAAEEANGTKYWAVSCPITTYHCIVKSSVDVTSCSYRTIDVLTPLSSRGKSLSASENTTITLPGILGLAKK